jgi:uncharacterized membrane protein YeaQ/YmgE (transglycosylase-associated protein family)
MYYSRLQVATIVVGVVGCIVMLWLTKQFHEMDAGYLPYASLLGAFVCISVSKGAFMSGQRKED